MMELGGLALSVAMVLAVSQDAPHCPGAPRYERLCPCDCHDSGPRIPYTPPAPYNPPRPAWHPRPPHYGYRPDPRPPAWGVSGRPVRAPGPVVYIEGPPIYVDAPPVYVEPAQVYVERPQIIVRPSEVIVAPPEVHFEPCPTGADCRPAPAGY